MDATVAVNTSKKALDSLRVVPPWLFVALGLVGLMLLVIPSFHATVPEAVRPYVPLATAIIAVLFLCSATNTAASHLRRRWRVAAAHDRLKLIHFYRPLVALFLTRHLTGSTIEKAPRFRDRLGNAWDALHSRRRRHRRTAVKRVFRALFDRQKSTSVEVEFGGAFPLTEIVKLTRREARHADRRLLKLVRMADRSRYEDDTRSELLTDAELGLFEYIYDEHERLSRKFD